MLVDQGLGFRVWDLEFRFHGSGIWGRCEARGADSGLEVDVM